MKKSTEAIRRFHQDDVTVSQVTCKYHGFFKMNEYQLSHKLFNGGQSELIHREIFERGDAVVVMPYDPVQDKLLLIEQFRPGALRRADSPWLLEFIAGMFNEQEKPVDVAIREAKEEADLQLNEQEIQPIMEYLSSPGGMSESIHLYWAKVNADEIKAGRVCGLDDEHEDILLHLVTREQALTLLSEGKITNAATIIALQWLALNYKGLA